MAQPYNNRSLFSDYYLEELVQEDSHWQTLKSKAWEFRQRIANILDKAIPGINGSTPEAEVERRLIRPILDTLQHVYSVQPAVPSSEGVRRPDYAFFPSQEALREADSHKGKLEFFKTALAIGDAKAWERSLDKRVKGLGDPFTNHNPSYQIDFYLRATDKRWGLLTNGRHWRLYHRDLSYRLDVYYEVDLPEIISLDENALLYFLAFFHKEAFQPDGSGECFLDRAYKSSLEYAAVVSEELKDNVYEALRLLTEGFLSFSGNNLKSEDLDLVRENAFIVIYRLLFVLYAEAREFLPVDNPTYWGTYSLRALTREIATKEPFELKLSPTTTVYWSRLRELFSLINNGDTFLRIPPYNGRLFDDDKEHENLAIWRIGDRYLAAAIDQLARAKAAGRTGRGFVSYRDLSIRELGSIYEGLLEHRPRYATRGVALVKEDKREKFIPLTELGNRKALKIYPAGSVYLETDKGERKATGSYYTPDYIVKYIVSNTLGPLLEEVKRSDGNLIDTILSLKVLDPAMGSGHFLVEAIDFLARALVEALGGDLRDMEEDEIRWARREVVERCIYGVDLNPLAVDLAKLSLWLSTVSLDKPLNFLDHHLCCGNSLIGARLEELGQLPLLSKRKQAKTAPASQSLLEYYFHQNVATAVDHYFRIAAISSDKLQDIQEKEKLYGIARDILKRYRQVADIWTGVYFGNGVPPDGYMMLQDRIRATEPEWAELEKLPWFAKGIKMAEERHFFHWVLEFPEVFFDRNGNRVADSGFNAVIGNPPMVSSDNIAQDQKCFLEHQWTKTAQHRFDISFPFWEIGFQILRSQGKFSLLFPSHLLSGEYFTPTRQFMITEWQIEEILDFGERFFPEVANPICLVRAIKGAPEPIPSILVAEIEDEVALEDLQRNKLPIDILRDDYIVNSSGERFQVARFFVSPHVIALKRRIKGYPMLNDVTVVCDGIQTADLLNELFTQMPERQEHYSRALRRGESIPCRYGCVAWEGWWVLKPEFTRHFKRPGFNYDSPRRMQCFSSDRKIILRQTEPTIVATIDDAKFLFPNSIFQIIVTHKQLRLEFLLSLLNSKLVRSFYDMLARVSGTTKPQLYLNLLKAMPIRRINFTTPEVERERLVEEGRRLYQEYLETRDWNKVLRFVGERLPQKPDGTPDIEHEQSDVVHDLLAFLAEEMTRLHKEKQAEIKGFLNWLEAYLGVSIEELKNKTKIKEYYKTEVGWEGFRDALEQNRKAVQLAKGIDITRREPQETIQSEFDASVAKLNPLLEHIQLTDQLIDQIVYKLYGLTEQEIAVVEEHV